MGQLLGDTSPESVTMTLDVNLSGNGLMWQEREEEYELENVGSDILASDRVFGNTFLVASHLCEVKSRLLKIRIGLQDSGLGGSVC